MDLNLNWGQWIDIVTIILSTVAIIISIYTLIWTVANSKARIEFSKSHISLWNKNQLVVYTILRNTSNRDMTLEQVLIYWRYKKHKKYDSTTYLKMEMPRVLEHNCSSKLEIAFSQEGLGNIVDIEKARIVLDTTFGYFEKTLSVNLSK